MRLAALSRFGWKQSNGRKIPNAPWQVSGRDSEGKQLKNPSHAHAFWLPEDVDNDGLIDHVSVYIASGIDSNVRNKLARIARLWIPQKDRSEAFDTNDTSAVEWKLVLEGFGQPADFAAGASIFGVSAKWRSTTPFLASGHLKAAGYAGEICRLLKRRGIDTRFGFNVADVSVTKPSETSPGEVERRAIQFQRIRSRGGERQPDAVGTMLEVVFPTQIEGPLALGFASHFGLGLFAAVN